MRRVAEGSTKKEGRFVNRPSLGLWLSPQLNHVPIRVTDEKYRCVADMRRGSEFIEFNLPPLQHLLCLFKILDLHGDMGANAREPLGRHFILLADDVDLSTVALVPDARDPLDFWPRDLFEAKHLPIEVLGF